MRYSPAIVALCGNARSLVVVGSIPMFHTFAFLLCIFPFNANEQFCPAELFVLTFDIMLLMKN
jgi:hypothetical protein